MIYQHPKAEKRNCKKPIIPHARTSANPAMSLLAHESLDAMRPERETDWLARERDSGLRSGPLSCRITVAKLWRIVFSLFVGIACDRCCSCMTVGYALRCYSS